jgi:Uma2 family endonuclease
MAFLIDEAYLPATLTSPPMSDQQFAELCSGHPDLFFETTADGDLIIMPPNYSTTGARNLRISLQLGNWAEKDGRGVANDSSTGYLLPNGARRSPDASWTLKGEIRKLPDDSRQEYITNGAQLVWLIDPETRSVEVFRPNAEPTLRTGVDSIAVEGLLTGFVLDLRTLWDPLA